MPGAKSRPNPKSTPKEIAGSHGHRSHGPSILWPALYEHLRAKGYSKEKAARISNAGWHKKRAGIATNTPTSARGVAKGSPGPDGVHKPEKIQGRKKCTKHSYDKSGRCSCGKRKKMVSKGEHDDGSLIALFLKPTAATKLCQPTMEGAVPEDEMHVTILYLGKNADISEDRRAVILRRIAELAAVTRPFHGVSAEYGSFPAKDGAKPSQWVRPAVEGLSGLHDAVCEALDGFYDPDKVHKPYKPHITICYDDRKPVESEPVFLAFDSISCVFGREVHSFPMGRR